MQTHKWSLQILKAVVFVCSRVCCLYVFPSRLRQGPSSPACGWGQRKPVHADDFWSGGDRHPMVRLVIPSTQVALQASCSGNPCGGKGQAGVSNDSPDVIEEKSTELLEVRAETQASTSVVNSLCREMHQAKWPDPLCR